MLYPLLHKVKMILVFINFKRQSALKILMKEYLRLMLHTSTCDSLGSIGLNCVRTYILFTASTGGAMGMYVPLTWPTVPFRVMEAWGEPSTKKKNKEIKY